MNGSLNFADVAAAFDAAEQDPRAAQRRAEDHKIFDAMEAEQRQQRPPPGPRFVEPRPRIDE